MKVLKRNGTKEEINLKKIQDRLGKLKLMSGDDQPLKVDTDEIAIKVVSGLYDGVTTRELDDLASEVAASRVMRHPDYDKLAVRILVSRMHKEMLPDFETKMMILNNERIISDKFYQEVNDYKRWNVPLSGFIDYSNDYSYSYFGLKTLMNGGYLLKDQSNNIIETPQDMIMRVAAHMYDSEEWICICYEEMSSKDYTHATPTLFNAGTNKPQLSSCFLLDMDDDSIDGIYKTLGDCAKISKSAGGIGLSIQKVRSSGSSIGASGISDGIVPMLRVFDTTARYVNQEGKRKGSFAMYIEPWHPDIFDFLDLKKNHGKEEMRARDLFYAIWINDLFMERVKDDSHWTLFDPSKHEELIDLYGDKFNERFEQLEKDGKGRRIQARDLWDKILVSQVETGTPYMLYKDASNKKSNQKNLGTIHSSNLCTEIIQHTNKNEIAVCNLASISLPNFIHNGSINFDRLRYISDSVTRNLNKIIDTNFYPVEEGQRSNFKHRPIGIGVQGLADVFAMLRMSFCSDEAKLLNKRIFETIYLGAVEASIDLAKEHGRYQSFEGSPTDSGLLQFDLWNVNYDDLFWEDQWDDVKAELAEYGMRNSLLVAPMPTASTSQILGNNECFEPFTSNIYSRRTLSGEFPVVNKHLVRDLEELDLWDERMVNTIMKEKGSIQRIDVIPNDIKERYLTAYEMRMKDIIDMSADRAPFICQSQSLNLFVDNPSMSQLTSMHFYAWKKGLKTGQYYLRSKPATDAISGLGADTSDCLMCSG